MLPTPVFWEFHGLYNPWDGKESDMTQRLSLSLSNNKDLLHSTGNHIQYLVLNHNGKESEKDFIYIYIRSVAQSCQTLCDHMNPSTPGLPVHHQLLEFTETHVHRVSDAILPSHPLSSPSPPAPNPSQYIQNWITLMYIWNYYKTVNQL